MAAEANMMAPTSSHNDGLWTTPLHLMQEEEFLDIQNKILISKTSFLC